MRTGRPDLTASMGMMAFVLCYLFLLAIIMN
jgi:hypothetical protein